jgi:hypothetical protein
VALHIWRPVLLPVLARLHSKELPNGFLVHWLYAASERGLHCDGVNNICAHFSDVDFSFQSYTFSNVMSPPYRLVVKRIAGVARGCVFSLFLDLQCHHAFRICGKDDRCPTSFPYAFSTFFKHNLSDSFGSSKRPCVPQVFVTQERSGWHDDMEKEENASSEKASDSLPQVCKHGDMTFENKIP